MNEVVYNVLNSVSWKVAERLQASGIGPEEPLATEIQDILESHRNPPLTSHYLLPKFSDTSSLSIGCKCDNVKYIL